MADDQAAAVAELLPFTRWTIVDLEPSSLERVAAYLDGLISLEPLKSGQGWANERIVLGCIVTDLRTMVRAAGEPTGPARDLRDARTKRDEIDAQQRLEQAERAYHDHISAALDEDRHDRDRAAHDPRHQLSDAPAPAPVTPAAVQPDVDSLSWL